MEHAEFLDLRAGSVLDIRVGDATHRIGRIGLEVQFEAAGRIRALRDARFERTVAACARLDGEALHIALELAFAQHQKLVSDAEVLQWLHTLEGTVFTLWHALRKHASDVGEDQAREIYQRMTPSQLTEAAGFLAEGVVR